MNHAAHFHGLWLGCLLAGASAAAGEPLPDDDLLEFLGGWTDDAIAEDWLDFLDGAALDEPEPAPGAGKDERTTTDEGG